MGKRQYKVICKIYDDEEKSVEYPLFIGADDFVDAEYKAKHYMITERPEIDFIRVLTVFPLSN